MARRASMRLRLPRAIGGVLAVLSRGFTSASRLSPGPVGHGAAERRPTRGAKGAKDAGAVTADRELPASGDAGAATVQRRRRGGPGRTTTTAPPAPTFRPHAPPLPPPTPEQVAAYQAMHQEADAYAQGARDYKDAITTIITLHYAEKKRSILGGLDREIGDREGRAEEGARDRRSSGSRTSSPSTAAPTPSRRRRPTRCTAWRRSTRSAARSDDDPNSRPERHAQAGHRALQARHPRVSEVQRARGHLLLPRARAQRLAPDAGGAAGVALARLPQPLPVPGGHRPEGSRRSTPVAALPQDHDADVLEDLAQQVSPTPSSLKKGREGRHDLRGPVSGRLRR